MLTHAQETSINAYQQHRACGRARGQALLVLNYIRMYGGDWSIGELACALGMEKSTLSARIHELLHDTQELETRPRRKDRVSGIMVRPVGVAGQGA